MIVVSQASVWQVYTSAWQVFTSVWQVHNVASMFKDRGVTLTSSHFKASLEVRQLKLVEGS
jgi:hypothetical protein